MDKTDNINSSFEKIDITWASKKEPEIIKILNLDMERQKELQQKNKNKIYHLQTNLNLSTNKESLEDMEKTIFNGEKNKDKEEGIKNPNDNKKPVNIDQSTSGFSFNTEVIYL